jgi:hypothetical protein
MLMPKLKKKTEPKPKVQIEDCIKKRYQPPEWGVLWEVKNATGASRVDRYADAVAMNLWPSRGLSLIGIEIKKYRGDWLRELRSPAKSEAIQQYMDHWYVVAEPGVVEDGELPDTWGLLVRQGKRLVCKVEAPKLDARPVNKQFFAAVFRRLAEAQLQWIPRDEIKKELSEQYDKGHHDGENTYELKQLRADYNGLKESVARFEEAAGVKIDHWYGKRIGAAVKLVLNGGADGQEARLASLAESAEDIAQHIRRMLAQGGS